MRHATFQRRWSLVLAGPLVLFACSPIGEHTFSSTGGAGGTGGKAGGQTTTTSTSSTPDLFDGGQGGGTGGGGGAVINCTPGGMDDDVDGDGFTPNQGDCDDCDPNVNPNAVEVPTPTGGTPKDENCNGVVDEVEPPCDTGLVLDDLDPINAAKAADLCKVSTGPKDWGLVSAKYVLPDGTEPSAAIAPVFHLGHGLLDHFGAHVKVQRGARMLGLSSGTARNPSDPGYQNVRGYDKKYTSGLPPGFVEDPGCASVTPGNDANDGAAIELTINTPSNAKGFSFDFNFFTYEWPDYVCDQYNDYFVALLSGPGLTPKNISFDSQMHPVSVNNAFVEVCGCPGNPPSPCVTGVLQTKSFTCALGDTGLIGTGFGFDSDQGTDHGSTGWLRTTAPVPPNTQIKLLWAVFDSADGILDTTILVDNFQWTAKPGVSTTTIPVPH